MTSNHEGKLVSPEEKTVIDRLATHYAPTPMTSARRVAFDRALAERITRRTRVSVLRPVAVVATAWAAVLIWLTAYHGPHSPNGGERPATGVVAREGAAQPAGEANLLTYAYYSAEFYDDEGEGEEEGFLPDEYEALVSAFALPDA
jgi:hypothetical protein